ncbi:MAG: dimethyl sulfoxide reductase anchor subunit [Proteobacteria bacterium]|nr:dimethyl sulfoxide reductase anchor subunit [Pseudomonadota bacterium]
MHPALSVILFTTASGAGYGLLILLAVFAALGLLPAYPGFGVAAFGIALGLVSFGLAASTFHLGHPERAWRAFSQWRSSWLSREGVASVATYLPALGFAFGWVWLGEQRGGWAALGLLAALSALATLVCTGMIYASLPTIQRWHNGWVVPNYLALGGMSGAVLLDCLTRLFGLPSPAIGTVTVVLIALAAVLKLGYWRHIDTTAAASTPATATGLGGGTAPVRLLEAPHTEDNYLMREMGFRIARKHAAKLRRIALAAGFAAPFALILLALLLGGVPGVIASTLAVPVVALGVVIERWLFFAEARHTVMLYYGATAA